LVGAAAELLHQTACAYPLLRGGGAALIKQMQRYLKIGGAREVRHLLQERFDLPGRADFLR